MRGTILMTIRRSVVGVVTAVVLVLGMTGCHRSDQVVTPVGSTSHPAFWSSK